MLPWPKLSTGWQTWCPRLYPSPFAYDIIFRIANWPTRWKLWIEFEKWINVKGIRNNCQRWKLPEEFLVEHFLIFLSVPSHLVIPFLSRKGIGWIITFVSSLEQRNNKINFGEFFWKISCRWMIKKIWKLKKKKVFWYWWKNILDNLIAIGKRY